MEQSAAGTPGLEKTIPSRFLMRLVTASAAWRWRNTNYLLGQHITHTCTHLVHITNVFTTITDAVWTWRSPDLISPFHSLGQWTAEWGATTWEWGSCMSTSSAVSHLFTLLSRTVIISNSGFWTLSQLLLIFVGDNQQRCLSCQEVLVLIYCFQEATVITKWIWQR